MSKLEVYRKEIDEIDEVLVKLFEKRMNIVKQVATYKKENDLPIFYLSREEAVVQKAVERLEDKGYTNEVIAYMKKIMEISKHIQFDTIK